MAPIRVGIIGLGTAAGLSPGAWGVIAHLASIKALKEYEIVAVSNSSVESSQRSIDHHQLGPNVKAYGNPEDLANDPQVDLVVVSVHVGKHLMLTRAAIEKKKDVFLEWPIGAGLAESEELVRLAAQNGVKTMVGVQARADPFLLKVKELIATGKIGQVISTTATISVPLPLKAWFEGSEYYLEWKSGGNEYFIAFAHCKGLVELPLIWKTCLLVE
jgi:predicted dehydrogenase